MLKHFHSNALPGLQILDLVNTDMEILSNNTFDLLSEINLEGELLSEIAGNHFGQLETLSITCLSQMNFSSNNLSSLRELSLVSLSRNDLTTLKGNHLPLLTKLDLVGGRFADFNEVLEWPLLIHVNLTNNNVSSLNGLTIPRIERLGLARNDVRNFTSNELPVAESLDLSYNRLANF